MVSIDGDTSTNDMVAILASGLAENDPIEEGTEAYAISVTETLRALCHPPGAYGGKGRRRRDKAFGLQGDRREQTTRMRATVAKSVICSSLLKAAMFGADANWGRVLCAIGYSGAPVDVHQVDVALPHREAGSIAVCVNGAGIHFDEEAAKKILVRGRNRHPGDAA